MNVLESKIKFIHAPGMHGAEGQLHSILTGTKDDDSAGYYVGRCCPLLSPLTSGFCLFLNLMCCCIWSPVFPHLAVISTSRQAHMAYGAVGGGAPDNRWAGLGSGSFLLLTSPHLHAGVGETNLSLLKH